jgi:ABC-2 type transport system ATP-binding protein
MSEPALTARGLCRAFGPVQALRGLDLSVSPGEIYGLVGPDGAGKTTAIRILVGLLGATAGSVTVDGRDPLTSGTATRERLGYMPQQYSLYGDLTVGENLRFFASMFNLRRADFQERSARLLAITRLTRFTQRRADALSGGMYKKLALACALLHRPKVLVLDEPTNGVDPVSRREFWALLSEFVSEGTALLISTPYMDEAARCHRVGLIHAGRLLEEGAPNDLLARFPHEVYRVLGATRDDVVAGLAAQEAVLAVSPSGSRMRVVVQQGRAAEVATALLPLGATLQAAPPDFEDLFLARMREAGS